MAMDLTQSTLPPTAPTIQSKSDRDLLTYFRSKLERFDGSVVLSDKTPLEPADRQKLAGRRDYLRDFMNRKATDEQISVRLGRLLLRYPQTANMHESQTRAMASAYIFDLRKFPLWAIDKGMANMTTIDMGHASPQHPPSSLLVQDAVVRVVEPVQAEISAIGEVLEAKSGQSVLMTPEERAAVTKRVKARVSEAVNGCSVFPPKAPDARSKEFDRRQAEAELAFRSSEFSGPVTISGALAGKLGIG